MTRRPPTTMDLVPTRPATPAIIAAGRPTLAMLVPRFLTWLKLVRGRSENTIAAYALDLRRFLEFCGKASIDYADQVTFREVEMYLGWIQHEHGVKASTANRHRYALGTFWRWLRRERVTTGDPVGDTFALTQPRRLPKGLSIPEQERVLEILGRDASLIGRRDYAVVATALFAGLRVEELATLKIHDVDLEAGVLRVVGKGDKERELPIVPRLAAILRGYLTETRPALLARPVGWLRYRASRRRPPGPVSPREGVCACGCGEATGVIAATDPRRGLVKGRRHRFVVGHNAKRPPCPAGWYARVFQDGRWVTVATGTSDKAEAEAFCARVGEQPPEVPWVFVHGRNSHRLRRSGQALLTRSLFHVVRLKVSTIVGRPVSPHGLRHSFASRIRENGGPLELIQEALGHASIATTMIYAHISTAKRKAELAKFLE